MKSNNHFDDDFDEFMMFQMATSDHKSSGSGSGKGCFTTIAVIVIVIAVLCTIAGAVGGWGAVKRASTSSNKAVSASYQSASKNQNAKKKEYNEKETTEKASKKTPEYDVDDFEHPEDFYEWYKEDFVDYEEAEDYWDEWHED